MKILCLPYSFALSHISRLLVVAKEMRHRGHEVIFAGAGAETKSRYIEEEGFTTRPFYQVPPDILFRRIHEGKISFITAEELTKMIESDRKLYREINPDLVLADGRFSSPISAGIEKLPHAAIVNVSSTEYRALPYIPFFEFLPDQVFKKDSSLRGFLENFNLWLEMLIFDNVASTFKKLSRRYQLSKIVTATNCLTGNELTLLPDIPEYFPTRNLPENHRYIGPLLWSRKSDLPAWWPPSTGKKLIYISMGTTWIGGSFADLAREISKHELAAIITTGGQIDEKDAKALGEIEGDIYLEEFLPGEAATQVSELVICHGGNGTIYQALQSGRPVIGIPTIPDQEFNMRRVEDLGVGIRVGAEDFRKNPKRLFEAVSTILDDSSYSDRAKNLQDILRNYNAAKTAADLLENKFTA